MSDRIEEIIRRDLDRLPVLPRERWLPPPGRAGRTLSFFVALGGAAVLVLAAVLAGSVLRASRSAVLDSGAAGVSPVPSTAATPGASMASPSSARVARQDVLAKARLLAARVDRIEAKLIGRDHLDALRFGPARGDLFWLVVIAGNRPSTFGAPCCVPGPDELRYAMVLYDAHTGDPAAGTGGTDAWPAAFDGLRDESLAPDSRTLGATVVEVRLPDVLVVRTGSDLDRGTVSLGEQLLRADVDTAYTWTAGLVGGNAFSLEEMARYLPPGMIVQVTIAGTPNADGSYRLEQIVNITR